MVTFFDIEILCGVIAVAGSVILFYKEIKRDLNKEQE